MTSLKDHRRALWRLRRDVILTARDGLDGLDRVIDRRRVESLRARVYAGDRSARPAYVAATFRYHAKWG
jgi:hypothetical protein